MVDLQWHDACSVSRAFNAEQKAAGWPESMTPAQLAALQRPYVCGDADGRRAQWALRGALLAACQAGDLEHTTDTRQEAIEANVFDPTPLGSDTWRERGFQREW